MNDSVSTTTIPRITPMFRMQWEEAQNCHVLLYPEGMVKLSSSAGEIMKRIDGRKSIGAIIDDLKAQYPGVPLEQDVYKFLEVATNNGWLRTDPLK
ncbi:MAG: pyrroloquinoline quinone biosynthesis peptide chaperone PqqD [Gammaproteobacteria bacterium]